MVERDKGTDISALLAEVAAVAAELHPGAVRRQIGLDTRLDRELGYDSLGRVQLLSRLEGRFAVSLPDRVAAEAETPRDLLRALRAAPPAPYRTSPAPPPLAPPPMVAFGPPDHAQTWIEVVEWHARHRPGAVHLRFYADDGEGETLTYGELLSEARRLADGLRCRGVAPGDPVALMLPSGADYFRSFVGVLLCGGVAVPLYPPFRLAHIEDHLRRQAAILANARAPLLITSAELRPAAGLLLESVETLKAIVSPADLVGAEAAAQPRASAAETALLQYTSGSTGGPKGVILSHANLLANVRAIGRAIAIGPADVTVSWLPLYHDMGLIAAWLGSLYHGIPLVLMSPLSFIARPVRWLRAIHRYRGSLTAAPNFAFDLCVHRLAQADLAGLDLSSLRAVHNGAEAVNAETMERFIQRLAPCGLRRQAMMPVYGLAEASVGLTFPPLGRGPLIDAVDRRSLTAEGLAAAAADDDLRPLRFVSCGRPLPGHEVRVVDDQDHELPDRRQGRIQFRGPSATSGYLRNPHATAELFHGDWLDSGDLGYIAGGELYVTGRRKDMIIKAGRNIYPEEIEQVVADIEGIRRGGVVAFGVPDRKQGTERLVVVAETRLTDNARRTLLEQTVAGTVDGILGMPPDQVVLAPPNTLLKTSSGKLRRAACRKLFDEGRIGRARPAAWRQLADLKAQAARGELRRFSAALRATFVAALAWTATAAFGLCAWCMVMVTPGIDRRWRLLRSLLKGLAAASGTPLVLHRTGRVPTGPVVFVANHSSYLDGFVLAAVLPGRLAFIAKAELLGSRVTSLPLRRLETCFVERFDRSRSISDARTLLGGPRQGASPVFFPEGTLTRIPGLRPFHMGAFQFACEQSLPVVPVAIRGTRSVLRDGSWFPHPATITVTIGQPIKSTAAPAADNWGRACWLRDQCRRFLLAHIGEPDLADTT